MQINKFSKFYVSTKKENIKVYFQIDYEVRIYKLLNEKKSLYIYIINNNVVFLQTSGKF